MRFKLNGQNQKSSIQASHRHFDFEFNISTGDGDPVTGEMSGSADDRVIGKWLTEKDSGNESEPELSTWEFSKLNISPKPIHTRACRAQPKVSHAEHKADMVKHTASLFQTMGDKSRLPSSRGTTSNESQSVIESSHNANKDTGSRGFTRCLRSRIRQTSTKLSSVEPKPTSSSVKAESNNNYVVAQYPAGPGASQYCDNIINRADTLLAMTLTRVPRKNGSRPFDASSLYSVASDDFNESDDELISINGDSSSVNGDSSSDYGALSVRSPRLSSKRKRTTTLSADLEVESLLSPSVDDSVSSGDNFSISDFSEPEELMNCEIPRKRLCSAVPAGNRPFLDLEKMQDEVERSTLLNTKRRPRAIRVMCFSPIKSLSGASRPATRSQVHMNRELVMSSRFCPLTPVELS